MTAVMIGIDPHKGSHTAVAISAAEEPLGDLRVSKEITAAHAAHILEQVTPSGPVAAARRDLAAQFLEDLRGLDAQLRDTKKKLAAAVRASGTSLTEVFGFGPVNTGTVIGDVTDVTRFPSRDHFASCNGTAPVEVSSGTARSIACRCAGTGGSTTPCTWLRSPRSGTPTATAAPTTTARSPRARPTKKRSGASNGGSATPSSPASRPTPGRPQPRQPRRAREGNRGTTLTPARPAHTPTTGYSDKPLPSQAPPYDPPPRPSRPLHRSPHQRKPTAALDNNSKEDSIWRRRLPPDVADRGAQSWVICAPIRVPGGLTRCSVVPKRVSLW